MITVSAFADEISPEIITQAGLLKEESIRHIEFRGTGGKKVAQLSAEELREIKLYFDESGIKVSCIGSAIGKFPIIGDLSRHFDEYLHIQEVAKMLDCGYIRLFSFYCPEDKPPEAYADRVASELSRYAAEAKKAGLVLLHENEKGIFGDTVERCKWLFEACYSDHFRGVLDPANFVYYGIKPNEEAYPLLEPYLAGFHIKDAVREHDKFTNVPAGAGQGQLRELLRQIKLSGKPYTLALEPHLKPRSPETFRTAVQAFKQLLKETELSWK